MLCNLVHNFRNFKVRINAALALGVPEHRALYGQHFSAVWTALLAGLDNSEHMADFTEYKHRDSLLDQVGFCWILSSIGVTWVGLSICLIWLFLFRYVVPCAT